MTRFNYIELYIRETLYSHVTSGQCEQHRGIANGQSFNDSLTDSRDDPFRFRSINRSENNRRP